MKRSFGFPPPPNHILSVSLFFSSASLVERQLQWWQPLLILGWLQCVGQWSLAGSSLHGALGILLGRLAYTLPPALLTLLQAPNCLCEIPCCLRHLNWLLLSTLSLNRGENGQRCRGEKVYGITGHEEESSFTEEIGLFWELKEMEIYGNNGVRARLEHFMPRCGVQSRSHRKWLSLGKQKGVGVDGAEHREAVSRKTNWRPLQ